MGGLAGDYNPRDGGNLVAERPFPVRPVLRLPQLVIHARATGEHLAEHEHFAAHVHMVASGRVLQRDDPLLEAQQFPITTGLLDPFPSAALVPGVRPERELLNVLLGGRFGFVAER